MLDDVAGMGCWGENDEMEAEGAVEASGPSFFEQPGIHKASTVVTRTCCFFRSICERKGTNASCLKEIVPLRNLSVPPWGLPSGRTERLKISWIPGAMPSAIASANYKRP